MRTSEIQHRAAWRSLLWRVHAWAALIASPFLLLATITGLIYVGTPQIEAQLHGHLDRISAADVSLPRLPLEQSVIAAIEAAPHGMQVKTVIAPNAAGTSVAVIMIAAKASGTAAHSGHAGHGASAGNLIVYVNPAHAHVLGLLPETERFANWWKKLHSRLLQGEGWAWMIELAASWMLVLLISGVVLAWPQLGAVRARPATVKQWHWVTGLALSGLSLVIVLTGLTWSQHAGDQIKALRDAVHQAPPRAPPGLRSGADQSLSWQQALDVTRRERARLGLPPMPIHLSPPTVERGVWRASAVDRSQPSNQSNWVIDASSGVVLFESAWAQQTAFSKATAMGIPFHRGELGLWNQLLLLVFGFGILGSVMTGWVMLSRRLRSCTDKHRSVSSIIDALLGRTMPIGLRSVPLWVWPVGTLMLVGMPVLAVSVIPVVAVEAWFRWYPANTRLV